MVSLHYFVPESIIPQKCTVMVWCNVLLDNPDMKNSRVIMLGSLHVCHFQKAWQSYDHLVGVLILWIQKMKQFTSIGHDWDYQKNDCYEYF